MTTTEFKEFKKWRTALYPYDEAECGYCATQHASICSCDNTEHAEMRQEAQKLELTEIVYSGDPKKFRRTVLAFRKKFAKFYKIYK
jgi:hypothetical protein